MIDGPVHLSALIVGAAALAFWLERRVPALSKIGASLLAIVFGAVLSNLGLVPVSSPVYDGIMGIVTSLAIAWLLLSVDLADLRKAGVRMIGAFALAAFGTMAGAMVAAVIYSDRFGPDNWRLAGTLTGTYTGGSVNFVSVGKATGLPDQLFAGATAADAATTALWLGFTLMVPVWLWRFFPAPPAGIVDHGGLGDGRDPGASAVDHHPFFARTPISALDVAILMALGFGLVVAADAAASVVPVVPAILWLTTLALIVGHARPFRDLRGAMELGSVALHFFFVLIGILSRVSEILAVGVEVFFYTLILVGVHGLVVFGGGRLLGLDLAFLSVASQASVGGPSSALAVAVAREWRGLILPGIIVGLLGYAVGTYLGFGVAHAVRLLGF